MIMLNETDLLQANGGFIGAALRVAQIGGRTVTRKIASNPKSMAALVGVGGLEVADVVTSQKKAEADQRFGQAQQEYVGERIRLQEGNA